MELMNKASLLVIIGLGLLSIISVAESAKPSITKTNLLKYLPDITTKELRNNFKVFLTKAKIRQVPLAKKRSERLLIKLYKEERALKEQMQELERNLGLVNTNMKRQGLRVIELGGRNNAKNQEANDESGDDSGNDGRARRPKLKVTELTSSRIDEWKEDLEKKKAEFAELRSRIEESKSIIKNPENYISIPSNYGRIDPEEVRENEREILINDRENMEYRYDIATGKEVPSWISDGW